MGRGPRGACMAPRRRRQPVISRSPEGWRGGGEVGGRGRGLGSYDLAGLARSWESCRSSESRWRPGGWGQSTLCQLPASRHVIGLRAGVETLARIRGPGSVSAVLLGTATFLESLGSSLRPEPGMPSGRRGSQREEWELETPPTAGCSASLRPASPCRFQARRCDAAASAGEPTASGSLVIVGFADAPSPGS